MSFSHRMSSPEINRPLCSDEPFHLAAASAAQLSFKTQIKLPLF